MSQRLFTLVVLVVGPPAVAAAQETALNPFSGNVGNAIWTLAIFVLVAVVLGKFAWGPVLTLLQERERFIHKALSDARHERHEAEAKLKEYTDKLQAARNEAAGLIEQARKDSDRLREDLRQKAQGEAESIMRNAERQIDLQTQRALQQIRHEAVDLSVMIASKLLQRNLSKEDNDRLIAEALSQVESGPRH
jgi:F-type H+-transporting ATPase subunit b